jgi:transcription elongation factor GreA
MLDERPLYLTQEGESNLRKELEELEGPRRRALAERLHFAIKQGDLSENADYTSAKEAQGFLEGRIQEIKAILYRATIVDKPTAHDVVSIGSIVVIAEDGRSQATYRLVGATEANPRQGRISNESPIGQALMGKKVGDLAVAKTPAGDIHMRIVEIR